LKLKVSDVKVDSRLRVDNGDVSSLAMSFEKLGQIQPIAVDKNLQLVAGFRRLSAAKLLEWQEIEGFIIGEDDEDTILQTVREFEENEERQGFSWQENVVSCWKIHSMYKDIRQKWTTNDTARVMGRAPSWIRINLQLARAIIAGDEEVGHKDTRYAAIQHIKKEKEKLAQIELQRRIEARRTKVIAESVERESSRAEKDLKEIVDYEEESGEAFGYNITNAQEDYKDEFYARHGFEKKDFGDFAIESYNMDAIECLRKLPDDYLTICATDPPFGIDLDKLKKSSLHAGKIYGAADTQDSYEALMLEFVPLLYRKMREHSHVYMFFAPQYFDFIYRLFRQSGFKPYAMPLIWYRLGGGQSMNPDIYPASCYEMFIFAHKGQRTLHLKGQPNVFPIAPLNPREKKHPAEKPQELWNQILLRTCDRLGEEIFADFFGGCGSSIKTILELSGRTAWTSIYCELEEDYYSRAVHDFEEMGAHVRQNKP
jgi:ParB family chromosome partitioning protein